MSDRLHPIPFDALLTRILCEYAATGAILGCKGFYRPPEGAGRPYLGRFPETAVGPAAGPHTQLAPNIVAAYLCGARVFELKTVQTLDGDALHVSKPCILAEDEGYNCEWSTELTVEAARDEYVKAWFLLHFLAREFDLGRADGFIFNMSVGYDLEGIRSPKIDGFLESLRDASNTPAFQSCRAALQSRLGQFKRFSQADLDAVSPHICPSVTISTMHGCPPAETERIARHLLETKRLNLLLKCNPTLVGYDDARAALDALGFGYMQFGRESFDHDLQYADAVPMIRRLRECADSLGLYFGVKLTNTFAVKATKGELPDEAMYMSGRALLPLSLRVAARLARDFDGGLPISYCGGADAKNIAALRKSGLYPVTVCTELLKPGGYGKLNAMAKALEGTDGDPLAPDADRLDALARTLCGPAREDPAVRRAPRAAPAPKPRCRVACGACAAVCPNRANAVIRVDGEKRLLHIDALCNECGNCASFCPDRCAPYLDKLTLFDTPEALDDSQNDGFAPLPGRFRFRLHGNTFDAAPDDPALDADLRSMLSAILEAYPWLVT